MIKTTAARLCIGLDGSCVELMPEGGPPSRTPWAPYEETLEVLRGIVEERDDVYYIGTPALDWAPKQFSGTVCWPPRP